MTKDMMKVEVISSETIKPSFPTPRHLRTFNLSFLDQLAPPIYVPLIFFYTNKDGDNISCNKKNEARRHDVLKKSLSETLTRYYPLAGRMKDDNFIIDCNDEGVDYFEARVHNINGRHDPVLSQVIQHPNIYIDVLNQFVPPSEELFANTEPAGFNSKVVLAVQVNVFDCGGIVIGVVISHKIADASSFITFINDWAALTRGSIDQIRGPRFEDLPSLFPQRDLMGFMPQSIIMMRGEEIVAKKFVFRDSKIAELKKRSIIINGSDADDVQECPTRVEALSALIWRCYMDVDQRKEKRATSADAACARVYGAVHGVNMRTRMVPPLPTNSMGNMFTVAIALSIVDDDHGEKDHHDYSILAGKIRDAIKKIDNNHVRELQTTDALLNGMKQVSDDISSSRRAVLLCFTSWCRFPMYEADFGWGKPVWVSICRSPIKNVVWFADASSGDGIEALVSLTKEDMAEFERHKQLLAFIS